MKKILISILMLSSFGAYAEIQFNFDVPQVKEIVADWDGDGIPNSSDTDSDNDGIEDINDTDKFSSTGKNSYVEPDPECDGYYAAGYVIGTPSPRTTAMMSFENGVAKTMNVMIWKDVEVFTWLTEEEHLDVIPTSSSTAITFDGYKYWQDESDIVYEGSIFSFGGNTTQDRYYGICRIPS